MQMIEAKYPVLVLPYHGGLLHCCHLDGYKRHHAALRNRLAQIEAFFAELSAHTTCRVWFNLDENHLNTALCREIAESLARMRPHICRLVFVGPRGLQRLRFLRQLRSLFAAGTPPPYTFCTDAEKAKAWLL